MPTPLPLRSIFDGTGLPTTSAVKAAFGQLRDYLAEQLGTTGGAPTAITSINGGQLAGLRNRLINASANINQRGGSAITLPAGTYTYGGDRWVLDPVGGASTGGTTSLGAGINIGGCNNSHIIFGAAGVNTAIFGQRIEASNSFDLAGKTVAFSFWAYQNSGAAATVSANISRAATTDTWSGGSGTLDATVSLNSSSLPNNTWTQFFGTATLSASAYTGLMPRVLIAGTLTSGNAQVTGAQLELGSVVTTFEQRDSGDELRRCQRYYAKTFPQGTAPAQNAGTSGSLYTVAMVTNLPVTVTWGLPAVMRAAPSTVTTYNPASANANWSANPSSPIATVANASDATITISSTSANTTAGNGYYIQATATAEL